ncbi:predicted protein [Nematostella vectensis]|uniref:SUEL-type lectin domain-containing protein n=1 Tax=Nematostella vectensis TaxID=45351 RepID=A7RMJ5_NEMVE|nr:predicted protein [Nematostella vectensis]|eukprot:XP_001639419.1 predicted protein [Nematostella vectensis]
MEITTSIFLTQGPQNSITCQGEKQWLQCPPYQLIRVNNAFWGRDDPTTCTRSGIQHGLITDRNCPQDEQNTLAKVSDQCKDVNACEVSASPVFFDRTDCTGVYKYLRINYDCLPEESRVKVPLGK